MNNDNKKAWYHLPGLFEFYELYREFLPLFYKHRDWFYDWCEIGSIYGAPYDCLWGGGRVGFGDADARKVLALVREYGISARLTFSNLLINEDHLTDKKCNKLCELFSKQCDAISVINARENTKGNDFTGNGVIVVSDLLLNYIKDKYPELYFVSSTTKVITDTFELTKEIDREEFSYVVPDFRINKKFDYLNSLNDKKKNKVEFLCNECCYFGCADRKRCYESVSKKALGLDDNHQCVSPGAEGGYVFSKAMENPGFIGVNDITDTYLPMGFTNFKIEGRSLGSAYILEFLLYYMTKPEHQLRVREAIYLNHSLDIF